MHLSSLDFFQLMGEEILIFSAVLVLLLDLFSTKAQRYLGAVSFLGFSLSGGWFFFFAPKIEALGFSGIWHSNEWLVYVKLIITVTSGLVALMAQPYLHRRGLATGEFYFLLFSASIGAMLCISANNLLLVVVGVELLSISSYILCSFWRTHHHSAEAGLKYFFNGAIASAIMLYAISLLYGGSQGHVDFESLAIAPKTALSSLGALLLAISIAYKLALVPFHWWAVDVYAGAPTPVSAFLMTVPKFAFFGLLWVLQPIFVQQIAYWEELVLALALITMVFANIAAFPQDNPKRMLAYSSISHSGYLALGLLAVSNPWAMLAYFWAYALSSIGVFAVYMAFYAKALCLDSEDTIFEHYRGLGKTYPVLGISGVLFMLSLGGFPLSVGFIGKFAIFYELVGTQYFWVIIIALLNSVLSFYYYLGWGSILFQQGGNIVPTKTGVHLKLVIFVTAVGVICFGIWPTLLFTFSF